MTGFSQFRPSAALDRFLNHLPPEIAASFSLEQLMAIESVLKRQQHPVDLRWTVPLLWQKFYIVLLAGPERRSPERQSTLTTHQIILMTSLVSLGVLLWVGLLNLRTVSFEPLASPPTHPTRVPFKADQTACENSGRVWQDDACLDYDHNSTF